MKQKRKIILGACALAISAGGVIIYCLGDHQPPQLQAVAAYQADCGTAVSVDDLVIEVQDQSRCTVTLSGEGEVSEDGRSISFAKAGTFPVVVEATDAGGKSTQVKVPVTTRDVAAPELRVRDIIVELGEEIDYKSAASAEDASDGDLSVKIQVDDAQVKQEQVGTYTVRYTVNDSAGNRAEERGQVIIKPVQAKRISLDRRKLSLDGNQHANLSATIGPDTWAGKVEWSSNDPSVATVSDGLVAWAGKGSCVITARADDQTATCKVTCGKVRATSVRLDRETLNLTEGDITILTADTSPSNWKGSVSWKSSDEGVATVKDGVVTAMGPGSCTITAVAGEAERSCELTCRARGVMDDVSDMWHTFVER